MRSGLMVMALTFGSALLLVPGVATAQDVSPTVDPPGFGLVTLTSGEAARLNVVCFPHPVADSPPDPCHGELMFHDARGNVLARRTYDLLPGESAFLAFAPNFADLATPRLGISPCVLPAPGGRAVPSVEVLDRRTRHVVRYATPVAARMFGGATAGDTIPSTDPPGFGPVTIADDQVIRLNVSCSSHGPGEAPPDPCHGELMFHNAAGKELASRFYDLLPGETLSLRFVPPATTGNPVLGINPCCLPAPGGAVAADVEVFDRATGGVALLAGPAVAHMTQLDRR